MLAGVLVHNCAGLRFLVRAALIRHHQVDRVSHCQSGLVSRVSGSGGVKQNCVCLKIPGVSVSSINTYMKLYQSHWPFYTGGLMFLWMYQVLSSVVQC